MVSKVHLDSLEWTTTCTYIKNQKAVTETLLADLDDIESNWKFQLEWGIKPIDLKAMTTSSSQLRYKRDHN